MCTESVMSDHVIDERKIDIEHWRCFRVTVRINKMEHSAVFLVAANKILFPELKKTDTHRAANASTSLWRHTFQDQVRKQSELSKIPFFYPVSLCESCSCGFKQRKFLRFHVTRENFYS
jgi:hypothetical protein